MIRNVLFLSLLLLGLCACNRDRSAAPPAADQGPAAAAGQTTDNAPVGPISSHGQVVEGGPSASQMPGEGAIDFELPTAWQSQPPSSSMRVAQAVIPGPGGPGDLAVFYFGPGSGGTAEANIQRWIEQMENAEQPKPETFETNGYRVTWVDVRGTLKASSMGMGPAKAQPDARLFGAVIEGPGGPWFFKATGPDATLAPQRDAFVAMLKSVRPKQAA
jgi:hypothetical protein